MTLLQDASTPRSVGLRIAVAASLAALAWAGAALPTLARASSHHAQAPKLTISPAPNTPDASPQTQISILGVSRDRIRSVRVTGSASGLHHGQLRSYSRHAGASFVPDEPFTQEESVKTEVRIKGRKTRRFSFGIAHLGPPQPPLTLLATQPDKLHHYVSEPNLVPPRIAVGHNSSKTKGDGRVLLTPLPSPIVHPESNNAITIHPVGPGGPMIAGANGGPLWFKQLTQPEVAANLRVQRYRGHRVLTWWQGTVTPSAYGAGQGIIANHSYQAVAKVNASNGYSMDIHEFEVSHGDAFFTVYSPIMVHLPGTDPGTLSPLLDAIVQEVDIRTGLVVWEWHSYGHIPLADSFATPANSASYDAFHINSVQALDDGRVLISARDTAAIYDINQASGHILWKLGGKSSDFKMGEGASFFLQHDARMLPDGKISLFDDEAGPPMNAPSSRGLVLQLHKHPRRATLDKEYLRPEDTSAQSEGNLQTLDGGRVFLGFGAQPFFSEFSASGKLLYDASLPTDDGSYRVYRVPWSGTPKTKPALGALRNGDSTVSLYASWNGATAVRSWQLLGGADGGSLKSITMVPKKGFETRIDSDGTDSTYAVRALDSHGDTLATSAPIPAPSGACRRRC